MPMDTLNGLDLIIWVVTLTGISYILAPIVAAGIRFLRTAATGNAQPTVVTSGTLAARDNGIVSAKVYKCPSSAPLRVVRSHRRQHGSVACRHGQRQRGCAPLGHR
jgi:hypothetical protein